MITIIFDFPPVQTSYWVMDEVLKEENPKVRAEIVAQFIRIAKAYININSFHLTSNTRAHTPQSY